MVRTKADIKVVATSKTAKHELVQLCEVTNCPWGKNGYAVIVHQPVPQWGVMPRWVSKKQTLAAATKKFNKVSMPLQVISRVE